MHVLSHVEGEILDIVHTLAKDVRSSHSIWTFSHSFDYLLSHIFLSLNIINEIGRKGERMDCRSSNLK